MRIRHTFNVQFIQKRFGHASQQRILQTAKLGIYTGITKSIPKISHPYRTCIIAKGPRLPCHPNVSKENLDPVTHFHIDSRCFNKASFQKLVSSLTIVDANTIQLFGYPTRSKHPPLQPIMTFIQLSFHHGYKRSIFRVDEGVELSRSSDFMQICIYHEFIVDTTGGYASSIYRKVQRPYQTINKMVCIKILSCGHSGELWCLCYQYTI